jgi:hypothetical protein
MRIRTLFVAFGLAAAIALSSPAAPADDAKKVEPKFDLPADVLPSTFRMFLVTDKRFEPLKDADGKLLKGPDGKDLPSPKNREGKIHCLVCEYGLNPVVAIFVRADAAMVGPADGVGKLIKGVDALIPKYRADKLASFVAFLRLQGGTKTVVVKTKNAAGVEVEEKVEQDLEYPDDEKRAVYVNEITKVANGLNAPNVPMGLAAETSKAVTAWKIGAKDEVTVIVYYRMRIIGQPWRFQQIKDLTDEKVAEILKVTEKAITDVK